MIDPINKNIKSTNVNDKSKQENFSYLLNSDAKDEVVFSSKEKKQSTTLLGKLVSSILNKSVEKKEELVVAGSSIMEPSIQDISDVVQGGHKDVITDTDETKKEEIKKEISLEELLGGKAEYIDSLKSDEKVFENAKKLIQTPVFEKLNNYQQRYYVLSKICSQDNKTFNRFIKIVESGYRPIAKNGGFNDVSPKLVDRFKNLTDEQFDKCINALKNSYLTRFNNLVSFGENDNMSFQRLKELVGLDVVEDRRIRFSDVKEYDEQVYNKFTTLLKKGVLSDSVDYRIKNITEDDYKKILDFVDNGADELYRILEAIKLPFSEYEKAKELAAFKIPGYDYVKGAKLNSDDYNNEVQKLNILSESLKFEQKSNTIEEKPVVSEEEKKEMIEKLQGVHLTISDDANLGQIAGTWLRFHISGGDPFSLEQVNKILPYACNKYESLHCKPLARWLQVEDLDKFKAEFPEIGEIYVSNRKQSFAKTQFGAELTRGNNFSDSNISKNVKFIVYPKNEKTEAYDTGEGKYGADEAIYSPNQEFRVLHKETQDLGTHKLYTIYMQEA